MIDRESVGKRLAFHRKSKNLSQTELAGLLNVTPQAVSKWEVGSAMPDIELLLALSNLYNVTVNEMLEENQYIRKITGKPYKTENGVAYFVPDNYKFKPEASFQEWEQGILKGDWIRRNWREIQSQGKYCDIAEEINNHGGLVLEIGAGPGGGFMPAVLQKNPEAKVIISDISSVVIQQWRAFLSSEIHVPNVNFAVFDNCELPFKDNSIDVISDGGGLGNTIGDKSKVLKEVYRVLKKDGLFVTGTGFVTQETLISLPKEVQNILLKKRPDIFEDMYAATVMAGFLKIDSIITGGWDTENDDSGIADLARSLGVNLHFTSYLRYCRK